MADLVYVRPDEVATLYATVTTTVGATDADYTDEWACDGRAGRPVRATSGTVTWSAAFTSAEVGLVAVCHCNSNVNATIGGTVSGTVTAGALQPNGIRLNGFQTFTPASGTTLTVGFSGASSSVILGELLGGKYRTLTLPIYSSDHRGQRSFTRQQEMDLSSIPPFSPGLAARKPWSGSFVLTTAQLDDVIAWYDSQIDETRPSLVIPDATRNDAWVCFLQAPEYTPVSGRLWSVTLTIVEVPRVRW